MTFKNRLKYVILKIKRDKKNIFLIIFLTLNVLIILITLTFRINYIKNIENSIDKSISFRTLVIDPNNEDTSIDEEKILKLEHVLEIYDSSYGMYDILSPTFNTEKYNGMVELLYGSENILPENVIGNKFDSNDTGVAICPVSFYPWMESITDIEYDFIDAKKLLNTSFVVEKELYEIVDGKRVLTGQKYKKSFKIIGLYDNNEVYQYPFSCYISSSDMVELYNSTTTNSNNVIHSKFIVVDHKDNVDFVMKNLNELGFNSYIQAYVDSDLINSLKNICNFIIVFVICIMTFISSMYIKKKNSEDLHEFGILKSLGYQNNEILKINVLQITTMTIISYLIAITIFVILFICISVYYEKIFVFNSLFLKHYLNPYVVSLSMVLVIPNFVNYIFIHKKMNLKSVTAMLGKKI